MALTPPAFRAAILTTSTTSGASAGVMLPAGARTYQATALASTGTGNFTVQVQGSIDNVNFDTIGTITLTSASTAGLSDSFSSNDRYPYVRGNISSLSTNITANLRAGA